MLSSLLGQLRHEVLRTKPDAITDQTIVTLGAFLYFAEREASRMEDQLSGSASPAFVADGKKIIAFPRVVPDRPEGDGAA